MLLTIQRRPDVHCVLFIFNDQTKDVLLGPVSCVSNVSFVYNQPMPDDTVISVQHIFPTSGRYNVEVRVWNDISDDSRTLTVSVLDEEDGCILANVILQSVGSTVGEAVLTKRHDPYLLFSSVNVTCKTPRMIKSSWQIQRFDNDVLGEMVLSSKGSLKLYLPAYTLDDGLFQVTLVVYPEGLEQLSKTVHGFVRVESSPIIARLTGGSERSISSGSSLVLDGSESYDPDVKEFRNRNLMFRWSCWKLGDEPDERWCSGTDPGSVGTIHVDTGAWQKLQTYIIKVEVSGNGKTSRTTQTVEVFGENTKNIAIL